jgi:hypothetical protein
MRRRGRRPYVVADRATGFVVGAGVLARDADEVFRLLAGQRDLRNSVRVPIDRSRPCAGVWWLPWRSRRTRACQARAGLALVAELERYASHPGEAPRVTGASTV